MLGRIGGAVTENGRQRRSCNVEINQGIRNTYGTEADTLIKEFEVNRGSHCLKEKLGISGKRIEPSINLESAGN